MAIVVACDSKIRRPGEPGRKHRNEGSGRDGCLASAGQRRGADTELAGARRRQARRRDRVSVAGRLSDLSGADLSGPAARHAAPASASPSVSRRRGPTPSISRPKARSATRCAPIASDTAGRSRPATRRGFPNISRRARRSRSSWIYNGAAPVPCRRDGDHGGDAVADDRAFAGAASPISACGRAASTPICSGRIAPSISIFRGRFS